MGKKKSGGSKRSSKKKVIEDDEDEISPKDTKGSSKKKNKKEPKKKKSRRGLVITVILAIILVLVIVLIAFWGYMTSTDYMTVGDVVNNKEDHIDEYVEVKGTVGTNTLDTFNRTFRLTDGDRTLNVTYTGSLPSNFEEGKDVVVKGTLREQQGLVLEADEIVVGCPSKY